MIKELEDYNWFPQIFRNYQMEYIGSIISWANIYQPLIPVMGSMLLENKINNIQDLCSGSGIPAIYVQERLNISCTTVLSDKFPPGSFINTPEISYLKDKADVLFLNSAKNTCYTMYNAFHHFTNNEKQRIIQHLQIADAPFIIAEILEPGIITMLKIIFTTTILQLLTAPFVRPFSLLRLLFTYLIPVNLVTITYDGIISVLNSGSVKQYQALVNTIANDTYKITVDRVSNWTGTITYIKGNPKKQ